jgi:hypothetical protein
VPSGRSAFIPSFTWLEQTAEAAGPTLAAGIRALIDELRRLLADDPASLSVWRRAQ